MNYDKVKNMVEIFFNGQYRIEKFLGEGSFAQVYLVNHNFLNEKCAMKIIKEPLTQSSNIDNIFKEVRLATKIRHENIIRINDAGIIYTYGEDSEGYFLLEKNDKVAWDEWAYFILEYVSGGNLEDYRQFFINSNINIPLIQVLNIIKQILMGLNTLHTAYPPIIHRDLKTGNILMGFDSNSNIQVKISDFGFAKEVSTDMTADEFGGTKLYMSPESFNKEFSTRSDVYAVGVIFYLLVTNHYPHNINNRNLTQLQDISTWNVKIKSPSYYNNTINSSIDEVILKSLSLNPEDRYRDAKEFLKEIKLLMDDIHEDNNQFFDDRIYQATNNYNQYNKLNFNDNLEKAFELAQTPGMLDNAIDILQKEIIKDSITRKNYTQILRMWNSSNPEVKLIFEAYKITQKAENYKLASTFIKEAIAIEPSLKNTYESTIKIWDLLSNLEKDENLIGAVDKLDEYMDDDENIKKEYEDILSILKTYSTELYVEMAEKLAKENKQSNAAKLMEFAVMKDKQYKTKYSHKIEKWKQETGMY